MIKNIDCEGPELRFEISGDDLMLANNCLNEVLNGFNVPDIEKTLGAPEETARELLGRVNLGGQTEERRVRVRAADVELIVRSVEATVSELDFEFSIRVGFTIGEAQSAARAMRNALSGVGDGSR